ncbi:MAG: response regulator [Phycisphaerales bacterium]|nr:response regulator [Phycisphaerales bacterium]
MPDDRPKLVVFSGEGADASRLKDRLRESFEVTVGPVEHSPGAGDQGVRPLVSGERQDKPSNGATLGRTEGPAWSVSLLNAIGEGVSLFSRSGERLWANDLFQGYDPRTADLLNVAAREVGSELIEHQKLGLAAGLAADGVKPETEPSQRLELTSADGSRYYEVLVSLVAPNFPGLPIPTPGAEQEQLVALVIRDVTAANRVRLRMDAIDRAGAELFTLDADAVRKLNAAERLKVLEDKVVRFSRDLLRFDHFAIRLLDARSGRLELVIKVGLPSEYEAFDIFAKPEGNGISGWVAATGKSYICDDTSKDELFLPGLHGARSSLTVPLRLHDKVIGILNIESQEEAAFDDDDRQLAEIFARYIAMAVHMQENLVVERTTTNLSVSGRVEGELAEPLADIVQQVEFLQQFVADDPTTSAHVARILRDVEAIRSRVRDVASGPQTLLGVEKAMENRTLDPILQGRRVLVADDQPKIRQIIGSVLRNRGARVTVCDGGGEAIKALETAAIEQEVPYDLVVSDIRMPDHNGYEVFAAAKKYRPEIPVILMTGFGYDPHHSIVRASQEGLQSVLFKPFQIEQLVETVKKALKGK